MLMVKVYGFFLILAYCFFNVHRLWRNRQICDQRMLEEGHHHQEPDDLEHKRKTAKFCNRVHPTRQRRIQLSTDRHFARTERKEKFNL